MNFSLKKVRFPMNFGLKKVLHRPEKVDTEKIFQLNNFSKVDNSDNFV